MINFFKHFLKHPFHSHYIITECKSSRLQELGFTVGTNVMLIDMKFYGKIFNVRGALIAIRNSDMKYLTLKEIA